jgi:hypothetical protein
MMYHGLAAETITSPYLHLDVLKEAGLRIVRLSLNTIERNLLAETPDVYWTTEFGKFRLFGGHRLSIAPEGRLSYVPDDSKIKLSRLTNGIHVEQASQLPVTIRKSMTIKLMSDRPALTVDHKIENIDDQPVQCAPWAISQLVPGGMAILPLGERTQSQNRLMPDRLIAAWPYTSLCDSRLSIQDDFILVNDCGGETPLKIGILNYQGWLAYLTGRVLLVKKFNPQVGQMHAHSGTNSEVYSNGQYLELETTGPLVTLEPGAITVHRETWEVIDGVNLVQGFDSIRSLIDTYISK